MSRLVCCPTEPEAPSVLAQRRSGRLRRVAVTITDVADVDDLARWIPAAELAQLEHDTLIPAA
jgi:hypothetical protein